MKMKKTNRKMTKRSALMAALIVAAITGVTPAFAAVTNDNLSSTTGSVTVTTPSVDYPTSAGTYLLTPNVTVGALTVGDHANGKIGNLYIGKGSDLATAQTSTLTADNMTIEKGSLVEVSNNSTLNIVNDQALVMGKLVLDSGTVRIAEGKGTLQVAGLLADDTATLHAKGGTNTVDGSVLLGANGKNEALGKGSLEVNGGALLTITQNLIVNKGTVTVGITDDTTGTLVVKGNTSGTAAGTITISNTGQMTAKKTDFLKEDNTKNIGTIVNNSGKLYLNTDTDYTKAQVEAATDVLKGTGTGTGTGKVYFLGGKQTDLGIVSDISSSDVIALGNDVTLGTLIGSQTLSTTTLGAKTLNTGGVTELKISGTGGLQLTGSGSGALISGGAADKAIDISGGKLDLGIAGNAQDQGGHLAGITQTGGTVNVTDGNFSTGTLTTTGGTVTIKGESADTSFTSNKTTIGAGSTVNVLHSKANLGTLTSTGGTLFADPAFVGIGAVTGDLNTTIIAGAGGNISIGGNEAWLNTAMTKAGVNPLDPKTSVLGVRETLTLGATTHVILNPDMQSGAALSGAAVQLGKNSLFVADMSKLTNGTAVILNSQDANTKTVTIDPTAKLYLSNLTIANSNNNKLFTVAGGGDATITGEFGKIINPDIMLNANLAANGTVTVGVNKASDVMPGLSSDMDGLMNDVWAKSRNSVSDKANAGIRLVSRATNSEYMTPTEGARVVEGAARMAVVGATQQMAFAAANAATSAATQRTSMANPMANSSGTMTAMVREEGTQQWKADNTGLSAGNGMKNGAALWIMPLYQNMNAWNMKADNFNTGYSANFGGVALGGDYTFNDAFRVGLALNLGGGFAESNGDFAKTENKFNFWGINLYGGWAQNNFGVTADVGYTSTFNDVKQDTPANLGMSEFKTDMFSYAISAGLRGEYKLQTEYVDVIPHIAARFTSLHSDDYKIKSGGDTVFKGEAIDQSIWTFPIGVAFSKDVEMSNGWTFKPQVDLAVIPAAGDIAAKSKVKIPGSSVTADLESNIIDGVSYQGALGFDMYKDNIAFGLNYTIQASEHTTGHGVQATVRYEF